MKKQYLLILLISVLFITSCKWSEIEPDVETPSVNLKLSESSPSTEIIISWSKCDDAQGYGISRSFTRDGVKEETIYNYISADTTSFTDSDCEPGTEYTYTVTAGYFKGKGLFYGRVFGDLLEATSSAKVIKTEKNPFGELAFPTGIEVTTVEDDTNTLKIQWPPVEGALKYEIYQKCLLEDSSGKFTKIKSLDVETFTDSFTGCLIQGLYNETEYSFKIKAIGEGGKSSVLSTYKSALVPKAVNTSMYKALLIPNGKLEKFYSREEWLWFYIKPEKGKIRFNHHWGSEVILLSENKELVDGQIDFVEEADHSFLSILKNINPGEKYLLGIYQPGILEFVVE